MQWHGPELYSWDTKRTITGLCNWIAALKRLGGLSSTVGDHEYQFH